MSKFHAFYGIIIRSLTLFSINKLMNLFKKYLRSFPMLLIVVLWLIKLTEQLFSLKLGWLGTHPRHIDEWYTAFTGALKHSDFEHLIHNTYPLVILGFLIMLVIPKTARWIYWLSYLLTGISIWLFARGNVYHVGASGLVYAWAFFLFFSGIFRNDRLALGIGLAVVFLYGGLVWGVLPLKEGVSWDGHLVGGISGLVLAILFKNIEVKKPIPELEDEEDDYKFEQYDYGDYKYLEKKKDAT